MWLRYLLISCCVYSVFGHGDTCAHFNEEECSKLPKICHCSYIDHTTVLCCNIVSDIHLKESLRCINTTKGQTPYAMHIRNATLKRLDVGIFEFPNLLSLSITDGNIQQVMGKFMGSLSCLNLSSNYLLEADPLALKLVNSIALLDMSHNNLTNVPTIGNSALRFRLDVSGNQELLCDNILDLMKNVRNTTRQLYFSNENDTFCKKEFLLFSWNSNTKESLILPLSQLKLIDQLEQECPKKTDIGCDCKCTINRFLMIAGKPPIFSVKVDCSNCQLTELPKFLPPHTTVLNVSNNNITQLDPLSVEPIYQEITSFYADNNKINSITVLEGSRFIDTFLYLTLRNNNIRKLPKYILSNAFDRTWEGHHVYLGGNKLYCDCNTAQVLKIWLIANKNQIRDYNELLCENVNEKVIDLDQNKVCIYPRDWTDYIYFIIAAEVALFLLLIGKVSYDYWVFKTAGYLPWPASKMPKMPCDWVFES